MTGTPLDLSSFGFEQRLNSFIVKQIEKSGSDIRIFTAGELRALLNQDHS